MSAKTYDRQSGKLIARIAENLPEMSGDVMQGWIDNPKGLQKFLADLCPSVTFRYDKRKDGWELLENAPRRLNSAADIKAVPFLKGNETDISGKEMVRRAVELDANLGQEDAEFMLEHQDEDEIPTELRGLYLVFSGTIWRDSDGHRSVPYLCWGDGRWFLGFGWLGGGWDSSGRLVRPRK